MCPRRQLGRDRRALATGFLSFVAIFVVGALLWLFLNEAMTDFFPMLTGQAETTRGADQISLAESIWGALLFFVALAAVLFIVARAVFEQVTPG